MTKQINQEQLDSTEQNTSSISNKLLGHRPLKPIPEKETRIPNRQRKDALAWQQ